MILAITLATGILLIFSPDTVPVHYNFAGEVDRMGSKYEFLLFPAEAIGIGLFFGWMAKRHQHDRTEEKALLITGISILATLGFLGVYFQLQGILYDPTQSVGLRLRVMRLTVMSIGLLLVITGNLMPKARRNAYLGLRTKWSLADDGVWQKSQRFSGFGAVLCGVTMILLASFLEDMPCLLMSTVLVLLWIILSVVMSYRYYKKR